MTLLDWLIVLIPLSFVMALGFHSRKYIRGVVDFLSAGRLCERYVLTVGDIANGISIVSIVSYCEMRYKAGYAVGIWSGLLIPLSITIAVSGYCIYRFRETKAQSLGQFLEMRYGSKPLRVFASTLRTTAEILAHSIMPAIAGRFFLYILGFPSQVDFCGVKISLFFLVMLICTSLAIALICFGGTLTIVITDTIQGIICLPIMVILCIFLLNKFDWATQIAPVLMDRAAGESFINPYDINNLRDFNLFSLLLSIFTIVLHRATWLGVGAGGAAKTPHEQKMASILSTWRGFLSWLLYILISLGVLVSLFHMDFAKEGGTIRKELAKRCAQDVETTPEVREMLINNIQKIPPQFHRIGVDAPISERNNFEKPYIDAARNAFADMPDSGKKVQEFRTLYHQTMMSVAMRHILCSGMMGLFCLLMVLAMVSTDDSYIFSSTQTMVQDLILPFFKKAPSARLHIWLLRLTAIGIGGIFLFCSVSFAQLDYIELFRTVVLSTYLGGCGPMMIFGLYGRFGTRQGAWTSLLTGFGMSLFFFVIQRNWGNVFYPLLHSNGLDEPVGNFLEMLSRPFNPWIVWEMNPEKFPINSFESYFIILVTTLVLYVAVSKLTLKEPFNLDRLLHRGFYNTDGIVPAPVRWNWRTILRTLSGITADYSRNDKFISWSLLIYSYLYQFLLCFVLLVVWNTFSPWPIQWWCKYFFLVQILIPSIFAGITAIWFGIGGVIGIRQLFRDLESRTIDPLDNGMVTDGVSAADAERFAKIEKDKHKS